MDAIKWPTTDEGWCQWFKSLDLKHGTKRDASMLHHDDRCPIHK